MRLLGPNFPGIFNDERGITALETAIILIAFIVAAAVFGFAILSSGIFATERGKESIIAGLNEVQSTLELHGQIVAIAGTTGMNGTVDELVFTVVNALQGNPLPLDPAGTGGDRVIIKYYDDAELNEDLTWSVVWLIGDGDNLLEDTEIAEITITNLSGQLTNPPGVNHPFTLEMVPPWGNALQMSRTTPPVIDQVSLLN